MSTVDFNTARRVAAGEWPEDRAQKVMAYLNAWDGPAFKVVFEGQRDPQPSDFLRELTTVWTVGQSREIFDAQAARWWGAVKAKHDIQPSRGWE